MKTNMSAGTSGQEAQHIPYSPYVAARARVPIGHAQSDGMNQSAFMQPVSPGLPGLTRETSLPMDGLRDLHLSGSEPRYFPGVVSHNYRRNSLAKDRSSFSEKDDPNWSPSKPKRDGAKTGREGNGFGAAEDAVDDRTNEEA
jgi:hypothetical protein